MYITMPEKVKYIIDILSENGYNAYAVGGCIRDTIMNNQPSDWDICTSSTPEETLECLKRKNVSQNGLKHGTVTVVFDKIAYEITTFRVDGKYNDNRHPENVTFVRNLKDDLARRDFTINALAYNDKEGIQDFFDGQKDIENKVIRCVGNPDTRFNEDALRILRALRFASVLGFDIDQKTSDSIHRNKNLLTNISSERIMSEFTKMIMGKNTEKILLEYSDVICVFIPEIKKIIGLKQKNPHHIYDVWKHTVKVVSNIPNEKVLRLAAFFHDIGKAECFTVDKNNIGHFYGHPKISEEKTFKILKRLRYDNKTIKQVTTLIQWHDIKITAEPKYVRRAVVKTGNELFEKLLLLKKADALGQNPKFLNEKLKYISKLEEIYNKSKLTNFTVTSLAVNGNDLINLGINQGKEIGYYLKRLFKLVVDEELKNEKEILLQKINEWKNK